jgi:hypothetical protein
VDWQIVSDDTTFEPEPTAFDDRVAEVYSWRREQLERAGYSPRSAGVLAEDDTVDLHQACALLERGCPERTAVQILVGSG